MKEIQPTFPFRRAAKAAAPDGSTTSPRSKAAFTVELKQNERLRSRLVVDFEKLSQMC